MKRLAAALFLLLSPVACGSDSVSEDEPPPPVVPPMPTEPDGEEEASPGPPCPELQLPSTVALGEGRSARLSLDASIWSVTAGPAQIDARGDLVLEAAYGAEGVYTIVLEAGPCVERIEVETQPMVWTQLVPDVVPPAREYGATWTGTYEGRDGFFLFGGFHFRPRQFTPASDLWFFDVASDQWTQVETPSPPTVPGARASVRPRDGAVLLHGGGFIERDGSLSTPPALWRFGEDAGGTHFSPDPHTDTAPGSYTGAFVYDEDRQRWLSVCGIDAEDVTETCSVHEYTEAAGWRRIEISGPAPASRFGFHYALADERVIIAAGQASALGGVLGDTWALDLVTMRWTLMFEDDGLVRRRNGAFAYDPRGARLFVFGGTANGRDPVPGLSVLHTAPGAERWVHLEIPQAVPPRASGFALYEPSADRLIAGYGNAIVNGMGVLYEDLFALNLAGGP